MKPPVAFLSLWLAALSAAQDDSETKAKSLSPCKYSCPLRDESGAPLVKKPSAFGWDFDGYFVDGVIGRAGRAKGQTKGKGWYDIFECVYNPSTLDGREHTCSYYKHDGTHALGYAGDCCPPLAPACPGASSSLLPVPVIGLTADDYHDSSIAADSSASSPLMPHFSSSQLSNAQLVNPEKGTYRYKDSMETPAWVQEEHAYVYVKEFPPVKLD